MKIKFYTADVFTSSAFQGAQIAVFPEANGLSIQQMQLLARELNLSESVFVQSTAKQSVNRSLRIFSPRQELSSAGHPVIAAAHVLAASGRIELSQHYTPLTLLQNGTPINIYITKAEDLPGLIQFSIKTHYQIDRFVPSVEELARILSIQPSDINTRKYMPMLVATGYAYLIVPILSYSAVRKARFNFEAWTQAGTFAREILLITPHTEQAEAEFHGRLLGPEIGAPEDPPIGSALPAYCGYLCAHPHIQKGTHCFTVTRGEQATRKSLLNVEMINTGTDELTLRVGGHAVMISEGTIIVPVL